MTLAQALQHAYTRANKSLVAYEASLGYPTPWRIIGACWRDPVGHRRRMVSL